ncbi:LPS O-antigen chain length determinant protein WzzB [Serratia sp. UGAL515B_01]|uniref:LPS O-antigen chain length determinant protein WzzB n=1 Tax=Serratia sp. UGAL515B_01 TaxID=2986763 RepID=UPI0029536E0D|nr:Wzz/FepE/Etk N-terminal domain-containing protein [Serratia sp. UGAL515B_01]WON76295.1 Wzz/FepE/Etk N-terminal domain-containing protein [Serratia sp. UGAL515B_01]
MREQFSPPSSAHYRADTQADRFSLSASLKNNHNEIDLFALLQLLWSKRWLIAATIIIFTLFAGVFAFTAKEKWTANTVLLPPRIAQLGDYLELRREYGLVLKQPVDPAQLSEKLFDAFITFSQMTDEKLSFLQKSDYYQKSIANLKSSEAKQALLFNMAEKNLNVKIDDKKLIISMQADSAIEAKQMLDDFIRETNKKTFSVLDSEFLNNIQARINALHKEHQDIIFDVRTKRDSEIKTLKNDLSLAQKSGIRDPISSGLISKKQGADLDSKHNFMLGEKILSAELQLKIQSEPIYPARYFQIDNELKQLALLQQKKADVQFYSYELAPLLPVQRDAPKRSVILIVGAFLGLFFGIVLTLIQFTIGIIQKKKKMYNSTPS